jgi:hypothetical protein
MFGTAPLQDAAVSSLLSGLNGSNTRVTAASKVYDFSLFVVKKDSTRIPVTTFTTPVVLTFTLNGSVDKEVLGVYHVGENNSLEYAGGTLNGDQITAQVTHFSKYAALELNKSFTDVPAQHWAAQAIKSLSAKQIVTGVTSSEFKPNANVTRAEFTALLIRALGIKAEGKAAFRDVSADAWYTTYVSAAVSQGIVAGRSADIFAPNADISREEMAVMVIRALEVKQGKKTSASSATAAFADAASISSWAAVYVNAAAELGLVQGRENNKFAPKAMMTRAESAQVIYKMLGL